MEYLSLYPEYFYSIIANSIPIIFNAIMDLFKTYEGAWCMFMDSGSLTTPDIKRIESSSYNISIAKTWIDAAINAYEQDLLEAADVVHCARSCVEELQLGLMRRVIKNPGTSWDDVICSIEELKDLVALLPSGTEKLACSVNVEALHRSARENYASLLLSDVGIDMIINFRKWMTENKNTGYTPATTIEKPENILIDVAKSDAMVGFQLGHLFPPQSELVPSVERKSNRTLNRGQSTLMLQAKKLSEGSISRDHSDIGASKETVTVYQSTVTTLPAYMIGMDVKDNAKPQYQSLLSEKTRATTFVLSNPTKSKKSSMRRSGPLRMGEKSVGKPLPQLPP